MSVIKKSDRLNAALDEMLDLDELGCSIRGLVNVKNYLLDHDLDPDTSEELLTHVRFLRYLEKQLMDIEEALRASN